MILEPGLDLTLRPMRYPLFYEMYKNGIRNTWTVDEVDSSITETTWYADDSVPSSETATSYGLANPLPL